MTNKVLSVHQLPTRPPILFTLVCWLLLDRFQPAGWVWGTVITLLAIIWIGAISLIFKQTQVKIRELL